MLLNQEVIIDATGQKGIIVGIDRNGMPPAVAVTFGRKPGPVFHVRLCDSTESAWLSRDQIHPAQNPLDILAEAMRDMVSYTALYGELAGEHAAAALSEAGFDG